MAAWTPVLQNPMLFPRLLNALRKPQQAAAFRDVCELMSIAVDPAVQGGGIGRRLLQGFAREACGRGCRYVHLTTDQADNDRVNQFYVTQGFQVARVITTPQGRILNEYKIVLDDIAVQ